MMEGTFTARNASLKEFGEHGRGWDSYGSGFMAGIIRGEDIQACMERGARKAAEIVSILSHIIGKEDNNYGYRYACSPGPVRADL